MKIDTHQDRYKMAVGFHTTYSNSVSYMKSAISYFIDISSKESNWRYISNGWHTDLTPKRRQAIIWTNDSIIHWHIYATHGHSGLKLEHSATRPHWTQISKFMGPTWGPPGSCRPQTDPMLAPWTLLSGKVYRGDYFSHARLNYRSIYMYINHNHCLIVLWCSCISVGIKGTDKWLPPTVSMGCDYLFLPFIPVFGTPLIYYDHRLV